MYRLLAGLLLISASLAGQSIEDCKKRFNAYLNFHGSLSGVVRFDDHAIYIAAGGGQKPLVFYKDELPALNLFFQEATIKQQEALIRTKGSKRFTQPDLDSLKKIATKQRNEEKMEGKPLLGYRIALDPGHFATTLQEAQVEQKFLYFSSNAGKDTVKLFESALTFNTASMLKSMLEEQGARVFLTRDQPNFTSFNCTFTDWVRNHKRPTLDSLLKAGAISPARHKTLLTGSDYHLFWDFFRDYDLANRAAKINEFRPDVTLIIHFNVDEKNVGWKKHTNKDFTMAFIGGAFTADNLGRTESRLNFVRLLLTDQLNRSQILADQTVSNFNKNLDIAIARSADATYLQSSCLSTSSPGVFCRNLALCRKINSPLVYGESLYQDNEKESALLMRSDLDRYGVKTNERLEKVAKSYYDAVVSFLAGKI